ncbi:phosphonate C-P lyase system protein PhnG [Patescibacteria group bacterium]|nr:phosphonate C-P lyase system protein PhnG [Patescibacteria group bacterium]
MTRAEYFEIIAQSSEKVLVPLAEKILQISSMIIKKKPEKGMLMLQTRDGAADTLFNLGEILVTECMVELDGVEGYMMMPGNVPEKAIAGAVIEAALAGGHNLSEEIKATLAQEKKRVNKEKAKEVFDVEKTAVRFEIMD